jgi:hypothetical protein
MSRVCPAGVIAHQWCCGACHETAGRSYIRCYECGHPYRTRLHLLVAYRVAYARLLWRDRRDPLLPPDVSRSEWRAKGMFPRWWDLTRGWWRPSRIAFCQCCSHDF